MMQGFWNKPPYGYVKLEKYEYLEAMHQADISFFIFQNNTDIKISITQ